MLKLNPPLQYTRSTDWSGSRLINCFVEYGGGDKREQLAVLAMPGMTEWADLGNSPIRGTHYFGGVLYAVAGSKLYSVSSLGSKTEIGTIAGTEPVAMADNGTQLCVAGGGTGYVYSGGSLTTPLGYSVSDVAYVDGYILWTVQDSDQFFISAIDDATTYDAADIAVVEGSPDDLVGLEISHRDVLMFGELSLEIYYNNGATDFPFARQGNAFIERGCFDRDSICSMDNSVFFVGNDRLAYMLDGYNPVIVSTHDIAYHLGRTTTAKGFIYEKEGHKFWCLHLDDITLCYDASTRLWHERQSIGQENWRINGACSAYGLMLFSDGYTGKLYTASSDVFDENGDTFAVDIYLPTIELGRERAVMYAFALVCEFGVGNGDVADPQVMLRYSDDAGHNWSDEMWRSLGAVGAHSTQAVWRGLGQFRQRQMHIRITDNVRRMALSYWADLK